MPKYGAGKIFSSGLLYGVYSQSLWGLGNIPAGGASGTPYIVRLPKKLALSVKSRRLSIIPQIRRLQVIPYG